MLVSVTASVSDSHLGAAEHCEGGRLHFTDKCVYIHRQMYTFF